MKSTALGHFVGFLLLTFLWLSGGEPWDVNRRDFVVIVTIFGVFANSLAIRLRQL